MAAFGRGWRRAGSVSEDQAELALRSASVVGVLSLVATTVAFGTTVGLGRLAHWSGATKAIVGVAACLLLNGLVIAYGRRTLAARRREGSQ